LFLPCNNAAKWNFVVQVEAIRALNRWPLSRVLIDTAGAETRDAVRWLLPFGLVAAQVRGANFLNTVDGDG